MILGFQKSWLEFLKRGPYTIVGIPSKLTSPLNVIILAIADKNSQ